MTPGSFIKSLKSSLSELGWYSPEEIRGAGRILLEELANIEYYKILTEPDIELAADTAERLQRAAERLGRGEPLQYILGYGWFYGYRFNLCEDVLIPRPETEELVRMVLDDTAGATEKPAALLDVCTGSGCIAIALSTFSSAKVTASDISEKALAVARKNAKEHKADVKFVLSDLFGNIEGRFDIIVSNPPYIPTADIEGLDKEVKDHEPRLALDGGEDGLDICRKISVEAGEHLKDGGLLLLECGIGQAHEIVKMLEGYDCGIIKDLQGIERIVKAVKKSV